MSPCFSSINHQKYQFRPLGLLQSLTVSVPEEAQVGETLYIFDDLLKRNMVTCVVHPKINIIQIVYGKLVLQSHKHRNSTQYIHRVGIFIRFMEAAKSDVMKPA